MKFNKSIFGMIHLSGDSIVERALGEIEIYEKSGLQGIIVENYHGSTSDVIEVLKNTNTKLDIGVNILPNEYKQSLEIADTYGCKFIQLDFVAGRYNHNRQIDLEDYLFYRKKYSNIKIMGGVWPKYYSPMKGSDLKTDIKEAMWLCDAIVVTGSGTGKETPLDKIKYFREIMGDFPLIIGSGLTADNVDQMKYADGAIVGSYFKKDSNTNNKVSKYLVDNFMTSLNG